MTIDWTSFTDDPTNWGSYLKMSEYINKIRKPLPDNNYIELLIKFVKGKRVLDLGCVEHTLTRTTKSEWKFGLINKNADYVLGIDILEKLVKELKEKGFNIKCLDATSDINLGEKFDVIHIGDLIEHVDNVKSLLLFAKRHLSKNGFVVIHTPNPQHFNYFSQSNQIGSCPQNLEHCSFIVPFNMIELCRRVSLNFKEYYVHYPLGFTLKGLKRIITLLKMKKFNHVYHELFGNQATYTSDFTYVISLN